MTFSALPIPTRRKPPARDALTKTVPGRVHLFLGGLLLQLWTDYSLTTCIVIESMADTSIMMQVPWLMSEIFDMMDIDACPRLEKDHR
jgi:hypothetical protein